MNENKKREWNSPRLHQIKPNVISEQKNVVVLDRRLFATLDGDDRLKLVTDLVGWLKSGVDKAGEESGDG